MISVLVPYRAGEPHRDAAWSWVSQRWAQLMPEVEVVVESDDGGENPGQFNHPLAINRAAARASGDVLIVADADTAFDPSWIRQAAHLCETGTPWVLPRYYRKLTEAATATVLGSSPRWQFLDGLETEWVGEDVSVSGLVVVSRQAFDRVRGYDERFTSWGADDVCFAATMRTYYGDEHRLDGSAYHLWHPAPLGETYGHDDHRRQHLLMQRYVAATGRPQAMRYVMAGRR